MVSLVEMFRPIITSILLAAVSILPLNDVCIEEYGIHVDITSSHACCDAETISGCSPSSNCLDLVFGVEISQTTRATKTPHPQLAVIFTIAPSNDLAAIRHIAFTLLRASSPFLPVSPIDTLRLTEILV